MKNKKNLLAFYNQLVNTFWTVLCFAPIVIYCYAAGTMTWWIILLTMSIIAAVLPEKCYQSTQLSQNKKFYERMGIRTIRKFAQNGDLVNRLVQQHFPDHRFIKNRQSYLQYRNTLRMYERFHAMAFVFFFCTTIHAVVHHRVGMALMITLCNIIYNVFPILLQQYNKIRLTHLARSNQAS